MQLHLGTNNEFDKSLRDIKDKYGKEMIELEGLTPERFDPLRFFRNFVGSKTIADISSDASSNVTGKNMNTMISESRKPIFKLLCYNKMFVELQEKKGIDVAYKWLEDSVSGWIYNHDASTITTHPYCYAMTFEDIANNGLWWEDGMSSKKPKHIKTFNSHIFQTLSKMANGLSGAVGMPDVLLYMYYYLMQDIKTGYLDEKNIVREREQSWQEFIFNLNQNYLREGGTQSCYSNISIFDRDYFIGMFGDKTFPDGSLMVEHIEQFMQYQKDFLEYETRLRREKFFTFPVITASIIFKDGKFQDEDFTKYIAQHNIEFGDANVYISETADNLSSCCFDENQKVLVKDSKNGVINTTFRDFHETKYKEKPNYKIFHNGNWVGGKSVKIPLDNKKMFKVTTVNNKEMILTEDHISLTDSGDVKTCDLTINDYVAFNTQVLQPTPENNLNLTYEQGVMIGAYLGDGSIGTNGYDTILSINEEKAKILKPLLEKAQKDFDFTNTWSIKPSKNNGYSARIAGKEVSQEIKKWVFGGTCDTKRLNLDCLLQNVEFRQGIIDGEYLTDGGNTGRIYSTSYGLIKDLEVVLTSLGKHSVITKSDRTDEPCIIRGKEFNRNFVLYTIKYYIPNNVRGQKDLFKTINNTMYFKIKSIEEIQNYDKKSVYCFEMKNEEEPYFTLPEGVITHNCRLKNDTSLLKGNFNSIGGTSLSIGSVKVITLNLVRCALASKNEDEFYENIKDKVNLIHDALEIQRGVIQKNIDKGLYPLYDAKLIQLKNQYSTVGINGIFEAVKLLGEIEYKESTGYNYTEKGKKIAIKVMNIINDLNVAKSKELGFTFNMEQVPFESGSVKHYKKDRLLYQDRIDNEIGTGIYGNQWIPLNIDCSLFHRLEMSALLDKEASGGAILHINRSNTITPEQNYANMIAYAKMGIVYYSDIIKMNICEHDHTYTQHSDICPICGGKKVDEAIKVVGYIVRKSAFQKERKDEMDERVFYGEDK